MSLPQPESVPNSTADLRIGENEYERTVPVVTPTLSEQYRSSHVQSQAPSVSTSISPEQALKRSGPSPSGTIDAFSTTSSPPPRKKRTEATPEVRRVIYLSLSGLALLFAVLMIFTDGLYNPIHFLIPVFTAGYALFYYFFPHDWEKEKYYMSHLHLASTLIIGLWKVPVFDLTTGMCSDDIWGRIIDMNSMAYFIVDSLVLIDTIWVTHHSLSIGCSIFGCAGTRQVVGGAVYVWYAEIGGLLYHISRMWADSKTVRQVFLVSYLCSRLVMLWIATISFRCTYSQFTRGGFNADLIVDSILTCFTTGVALVNLKFLYTNYLNYVKKFGKAKSQ
jgi:hypothetical protein